MVCIAAFIILCLVGIFVAFLSIFRRDIGRKYWTVFKKAWGCVGKKVRLQKCETNFKDDVKNSLLSKVVLTHPKWVKPLGVAIEVSAVVIVVITVWSLVEAIKALLALWVFGTCNVSQPASCALGAEVCGIDAEEPQNPLEWTGRWFTEWGEIFANIPDRFRSWQAEDYLVEPYTFLEPYQENHPLALDIFDPGCVVCMQSYRNQKSSGFLTEYNVAAMVYPIELPDGSYKFTNSDLIARYIHAANLYANGTVPVDPKSPVWAVSFPTSYNSPFVSIESATYARRIIDRLFTESNSDGINYQTALKNMSRQEAKQTLEQWLRDFGATTTEVSQISLLADSENVTSLMSKIKDVVENQLHLKGIPTLIYNGAKHSGLFES